MNERFRRINRGFMIFYLLFSVVAVVTNFFFATPYYIALSFLAPLFLLIPPLLDRVLRFQPVYQLHLTINLFAFLAFVIGISIQGYQWIPLYDKFTHLLSGVLFALIGLCFFYLIKPGSQVEPSDGRFVSYCAVSFAGLSAVLWEIWEYSVNFIFHSDPQNVLTTGVNDTMQDMIACLLGSLFVWRAVHLYFKRGKEGFFMRLFLTFHETNLKK